jgi:hypothetical protein
MNQSYKSLARNIEARLNPDAMNESVDTRVFNKAIGDISGYGDPDDFIHKAMKSVGPDYTSVSIEAGSMVKQHLKTVLTGVDYKYQGSVMTNTHVKGRSDIDLVCISNKFYYYDRPEVNRYLNSEALRNQLHISVIQKFERTRDTLPYNGNALADLFELRSSGEAVLEKKYIICDISHAKAVKITNQNLHRDVDIVTAAAYDDIVSIAKDGGEYRGIQVYNKDRNSLEDADYPFLSIARINERGIQTGQRSKKMVRFLKNIRHFSDQDIKLNSFDINAICYDITPSLYMIENERGLVRVLYDQVDKLCTSTIYANRLKSVDDHSFIFFAQSDREVKLANLQKLRKEIYQILVDLYKTVSV